MSKLNRVQSINAVLNIFRTAIPFSTTNTLIAFIHVATNEGCYVGDVQRACGMAATSTSRAVQILFKRHRAKDGYNLVESRTDWDDQRHKRLYLTPKGERLWATILEAIDR